MVALLPSVAETSKKPKTAPNATATDLLMRLIGVPLLNCRAGIRMMPPISPTASFAFKLGTFTSGDVKVEGSKVFVSGLVSGLLKTVIGDWLTKPVEREHL